MHQNIVSYTVDLTIAPFTAGTWTLNNNTPNFSMDLAATVDLQWQAGQILLPNAALAAPLTLPAGGFDAVHFPMLRTLAYSGTQLTTSEVQTGTAIALKGNGGRLGKILFTQVSANAVTFQWITYPYGF